MRIVLLLILLIAFSGPNASAFAQTAQPRPATVVPSPFQALGNIIRNPDAPPPQSPQTGTSQPLALPTAIPPNTIGQPAGTAPGTPGR